MASYCYFSEDFYILEAKIKGFLYSNIDIANIKLELKEWLYLEFIKLCNEYAFYIMI